MKYKSYPNNVFARTGLIRALTFVGILLLIGISGYYFWFGYSLVDAFYMTIITVGTVGFGEVVPLDSAGKIFTSLLILFSIFIFAYAVTTISAYLVSINSVYIFKTKKMQQKINKLKGHIIVCGYGRNGTQAANKLKTYNRPFVIVEQNRQVLDQLNEEDLLYIEGNGTEDEVLMKAGISNASFLITTLPSDADNVFITLTARQLNPNIVVYSRASEESSFKKLKIAGAQSVIMPDKIGGEHIASLIVAPDLIEFLDNLSSSHSGKMNVQEIPLQRQPNVSTIDELRIKEKTGCTVIGYKNKAGEYIVNPDFNQKVESEGRVIVLGNDLQISELNRVFKLLKS
ncbi:MAG: potassium channel protein [Saprospiraceae bacterium]|nr:potassium channel protein [Saprospiraceae bacterium]